MLTQSFVRCDGKKQFVRSTPRYNSGVLRKSAPLEITADQERVFYDSNYAQHLGADAGSLRCDRSVLLSDIENPARPAYERRRLYRKAFEILTSESVGGKRILDYGCGAGEWGIFLASEGASVAMLDLSPAAVELALRRARATGVSERVRGFARDASDLSCFADGEFDLVFACAALHHTIKYPGAFEELVRVIRPGGTLLLVETFGNNELLNFLRRLSWRLRRQPAESGEDVLFGKREIERIAERFSDVQVFPLNLTAMVKRLFRGRFERRWVRAVVGVCESLDFALLESFPFLRRYCGEVVLIAVK